MDNRNDLNNKISDLSILIKTMKVELNNKRKKYMKIDKGSPLRCIMKQDISNHLGEILKNQRKLGYLKYQLSMFKN